MVHPFIKNFIMKKILTLVVLLVGVGAMAQPKTDLRPNETVLLYADEFTDMTDPVRAEKITAAGFKMMVDNEITEGEEITKDGNIAKISKDARFDLYFPAEPNGQMVVVCPGGGYAYVSSYNEGVYVAEWMIEHGITVAVMKYRLPNHHDTVPLEDVQNAFRYCRTHAGEWGVKTIGVMGFSAGGHLAVTTSVLYADAVTRPDFSVFIYPVVTMDKITSHNGTRKELIGFKEDEEVRTGKSWEQWDRDKREYKRLEEKYSLEKQTAPDNPPTFIALSNDDGTVNPENSTRLYTELLRNGVSVELHIYPHGGHGWGFTSERYCGEGNDRFAYAREEFYASLDRWLSSQSK